VQALRDISNYMREQLRLAGIPTVDGTTAIVPILTYEPERTFVITKMLLESGVYVNPVIPPAAPQGMCLLRTSYTATHTRSQIDEAAAVIRDVFSRVCFGDARRRRRRVPAPAERRNRASSVRWKRPYRNHCDV
jgi:hypothetical protein